MHVFGPVPSRRLGRSLGVNNIPFKYCSYSCVYCQLGRTDKLTVERRKFSDCQLIFEEVRRKLEEAGEVDYITFVPDGEPTLDINLGSEIELLKGLGRVAVITNSSLLFREDVRADLANADLVSLKVDAVDAKLWKRVNRPHPSLKLDEILKGMEKLAEEYEGVIITETMLIDSLTTLESVERVAEFLERIDPHVAYLSVPTRPPAERVKAPNWEFIAEAAKILGRFVKVDLLVEAESGDFGINSKEDVLAIASVHPLREDVLKEYLKKLDLDIQDLLDGLEEIEYGGIKYYRKKN
ncbi:MAG: radical SAM protein [Archaeoglobus sp.]|uniref:radical SAM protein n=1 Tax=Archaeoglobus sp. TaxID=1872626 RepID=UPI001D216DDB|nr:radical SAM protein [Archaeoglobus sp.]MBO8178929.1 radical SAM protein [Archaeoglobus sp.]